MPIKPYLQIPIADCGEPLVPIPAGTFGRVTPHPYVALGAPYGDRSPFWLRSGVLEALTQAQRRLQQRHPTYGLQIFDAYRPVAVQQFMVDRTFGELRQAQGWGDRPLNPEETATLWAQVHQFWAIPSPDPTQPPPHSTGAAVDLTLWDTTAPLGSSLPMGSPIDECSPRSYPDHFATDPSPEGQEAHHHRCLLRQVMESAGFRCHPQEWWHFSLGDQMWAWLEGQGGNPGTIARYGPAPL